MTRSEAARLPTDPSTYVLRDDSLVCTDCGAVIGRADDDRIRHSTWHASLVRTPVREWDADVWP